MDGTHPCPFCAEPIRIEAIKCRHCGEMLPGQVRPAAPPGSPGAKDEEHLNNLALAYTVVSVVTGIFSCMPLLHVALGIAMLVAPDKMFSGGKGGPPPAFMGLLFAVMGGAFVLCGWTLAALQFAAGRALRRRVRYTFCQIVSGVSCLFMPFGTILGVLSLIVLSRPSVKERFAPPGRT